MGKSYSYDWVMKHAQKFILSPGCKTEISCIFTDYRVDRKTVPEGIYVYEIMGTDSGSIGHGIIKEHVIVNFVGTLLTETPIKFTRKLYCRYSTIPERCGIFRTAKVNTPVDLRDGEVLKWERGERGVGSWSWVL